MKSTCTYPCFRQEDKSNQEKRKRTTKKIQLVFFDMDGVLLDTVSSWKYIHDHFGTINRRSIISYLSGEIDYLEFIRRDVSLWKKNGKHVKKQTLEDILRSIPFINGAKECISFLKSHQIQTAIITAGMTLLADRVACDLGIDYVYANEILIGADGRLTGEGVLHVELRQKDINVSSLAEKLQIPLEACAAVGNSCFDIPMLDACGLGIAFNPEDDCVRTAADVVVEEKDLTKLMSTLRPHI